MRHPAHLGGTIAHCTMSCRPCFYLPASGNASPPLQRDLEAERLRMRQRSQQADEQQHLRTTVLLDNSGRKAGGQRPRSVLAGGNGGLPAASHRGLHGDRQRGGSPAPRAQSPALPAEGPHRSQSPALAAQPHVAAKKNVARSKLGEQMLLSCASITSSTSCRMQHRDVLLDKHCCWHGRRPVAWISPPRQRFSRTLGCWLGRWQSASCSAQGWRAALLDCNTGGQSPEPTGTACYQKLHNFLSRPHFASSFVEQLCLQQTCCCCRVWSKRWQRWRGGCQASKSAATSRLHCGM
jgi:hypothetical protein